MSHLNGKYHIINMHTGGHAALLDGNDPSDLVTVSPGLLDSDRDEGYEVSSPGLGNRSSLEMQ